MSSQIKNLVGIKGHQNKKSYILPLGKTVDGARLTGMETAKPTSPVLVSRPPEAPAAACSLSSCVKLRRLLAAEPTSPKFSRGPCRRSGASQAPPTGGGSSASSPFYSITKESAAQALNRLQHLFSSPTLVEGRLWPRTPLSRPCTHENRRKSSPFRFGAPALSGRPIHEPTCMHATGWYTVHM
jgi:hypothetical protein